MKTGIRISVIIVILILVLLVGVSLTQARQMTNYILPTNTISQEANLPWHSEYVHSTYDPALHHGAYNSIVFRPFDDIPFISYYDASNGDLMLATFYGNGSGNCGTDNNWHCEALDEDGDVGRYTSIDVWSDADENYRIGISYYDVTNQALKYITRSCFNNLCTLWFTSTISAPDSANISIGKYSSLKFGPTGTPTIAYYYENGNPLGQESLRLTSLVDIGGNCGEGSVAGKWNCEIIDRGFGVGQYASLDLTYDGSVYIAYYDAVEGNLKIANFWGIIDDDCYDDNGWYCAVLDGSDGSDVGLFASMTAQHSVGDKLFRIAYYDKSNGHLKYYDSDFGPVVVDDMSTSLLPMGISMDIDKEDNPVIAYQRTADLSGADLRIARPYFEFNDGEFGNCGDVPPGYMFLYWRCTTLENGGQYNDEAEFASMAIDSRGRVGIAYSEYDSYYDVTSLKFIYQTLLRTFMPIITKQ